MATDDEAHQRPWYRRPWIWVAGVAGAFALGLVVVVGSFWLIYANASIPPPDELELPDPTVVLSARGERIATLDPAAVRENVRLGRLPDHVWQAVVAVEDQGFFDHEGYSLSAIARAFWTNLRSLEIQQGASTITQQYVELAVEDVSDSYWGKFREVALAARLDDQVDKRRILQMYLNAVPWGRGTRGIEAAAQTYFGVPATELTLNQAATLAGMIAAPTAFDPGRNPDPARQRRAIVLDAMVTTGALDRATAAEVRDAPLPEIRTDPLVAFGIHAYFLDTVRQRVPRLLNEPAADVYAGLVVKTTLQTRFQQLAVETLRRQLDPTPYSGGIVTTDVRTGAVLAVVGGRDYDRQQFNTATRGRNQPGSAFKPVTLTELVARGYSPTSDVEAPRTYTVTAGGDTAEVRNYSGSGYGVVSVREATVRSINTAYVKMAEELGFESIPAMAQRLGIDQELPAVPSLTLGTGDVSVLSMVEAYGTLAAGGVHHEPFLVTSIENQAGEVLYEHTSEETQVIEPNVAAVVSDVLRDVVAYGTGTAAALPRPVAGKTGTTNDYRDAWFVGYTPQFATAVWVGNLDNTPMPGVTGGSLPAEIFSAYLTRALEPFEPAAFPEPDYRGLREFDELADAPRRAPSTPSATPPSTSPTSPSPATGTGTGTATGTGTGAGTGTGTGTTPPPSPTPSAGPNGSPSPAPTQSPGRPAPTPASPSPRPSPSAASPTPPSSPSPPRQDQASPGSAQAQAGDQPPARTGESTSAN